jgi:hypothetical protein
VLGSQYQWLLNTNPIVGAVYSTYFPSLAGDYSVIIENNIHCIDTSNSWHLTVFDLPTPQIFQVDNFLETNYSNGNQWYLNGEIIPGATDSVFIPISRWFLSS